MANEKIADDYISIAQRMRELAAERGELQPMPETTRFKCDYCLDKGWLANENTTSGWKRCSDCNQSYEKSRPPIRR